MVAAAIVGSAVVGLGGAAMGASAAKSAGKQQAQAADRAAEMQQQQYAQTRADLSPYRGYGTLAGNALLQGLDLDSPVAPSTQAAFNPDAYLAANPDVADYYNSRVKAGVPLGPGQTAGEYPSLADFAWQHYQSAGKSEGRSLGAGSALTGTGAAGAGIQGLLVPKAFDPSFTQADLAATPGYQFTLGQGLKAVQNSAAARGLGVSGAALRGAADYATGLSDSTFNARYQQKLQGYEAGLRQGDLLYNRLMGLTTMGQNAAAQTGTLGQQAAATSGNYLTSGAAAQAAGTVGAANAWSQGLGNAANGVSNMYLLNSLLKNNGGTGLFGG